MTVKGWRLAWADAWWLMAMRREFNCQTVERRWRAEYGNDWPLNGLTADCIAFSRAVANVQKAIGGLTL